MSGLSPQPRTSTRTGLTVVAPQQRNSLIAAANAAAVITQNMHDSSSSTAHFAAKGITLGNAAISTGGKLKRAFAGRRKKSEDVTKALGYSDPRIGELQAREEVFSDSDASTSSRRGINRTSSKGPRQFMAQVLNKRTASKPKVVIEKDLPPPPPKDEMARLQFQTLPDSSSKRYSVFPVSPAISSAVNYIRMGDDVDVILREVDEASDSRRVKTETKDVWRKSDATIGQGTIRPSATVGSRPSRPASMAESLQSNHTVVPSNKRLSSLKTDAELSMAEEDDAEHVVEPSSAPSVTTPRPLKRLSVTLNAQPSPGYVPTESRKQIAKSSDGLPPTPLSPTQRHSSTLSHAAASGIIVFSNAEEQAAGTSLRGRLAALTVTTNTPEVRKKDKGRSSSRQRLPRIAIVSPGRLPESGTPASRSRDPLLTHRPAAMSINGLGPAAGLAKRAVERVGRALGSMGGSNSGSHSIASPTAPSSFAFTERRSSSSHGGIRLRRTPNTNSGSWSLHSSANGSTSDCASPSPTPSPSLGTRIRGHLPNPGGDGPSGGYVFGKPLAFVVINTAVSSAALSMPRSSTDSGRFPIGLGSLRKMSIKRGDLRALDTRRLPALVVRCVQHILTWGIQEEGLFRVSGRPAHVAKLRGEFDAGADYDLRECSPVELDPHAVAGVFKAFLRELPQPILQDLGQYFETAMEQERNLNPPNDDSQTTPHLAGLRKPPSLSTLAMPNMSRVRPPSRSLSNVLRSLIARLPAENRDLLRTVTELIRATAKASKETKMPLSNLLLVFCPSLNMSPPLLRALCEAEGIWESSSQSTSSASSRQASTASMQTPSSTSDVESSSLSDDDEIVYSVPTARPPRSGSVHSLQDDKSLTTSETDSHVSSFVQGIQTPVLSSSIESLVTPVTSASGLSSSDLELAQRIKALSDGSAARFPDNSEFTYSHKPRRPTVSGPLGPISGPIQFPQMPGDNVPLSPKLAHRRSIPKLSMPSFRSPATALNTPQPRPASASPIPVSPSPQRMKRPSLTLLFAKCAPPVVSESNSGAYPATPSRAAASEGSLNPLLKIRAQAMDTSTGVPSLAFRHRLAASTPPILDTHIDVSNFSFGLDLHQPVDEDAPRPLAKSAPPSHPPTVRRSDTPIADLFCSTSTSILVASSTSETEVISSVPAPSYLAMPAARPPTRRSVSAMSNHLGMLGRDNVFTEDWCESVLLAGGWHAKRDRQ
ncbi:RhoGAP-domain-containing protein [Fistulina hepatica ATCC 64428]|uniref:RhoGAP-domain-containing protein n=1 Tax=Fistulina hepatica ATCC 64428 TaxID=1128425 RepID=A0A0D7A0C0_9AGAR|nr:RhoGAP-domain-containing protein [Fistulina hepatica ATCC 64428]